MNESKKSLTSRLLLNEQMCERRTDAWRRERWRVCQHY